MKDVFVKMLDDASERLNGRNVVLQLASEHTSDYERGRIMGQIDMITKLMMELAGDEDEA